MRRKSRKSIKVPLVITDCSVEDFDYLDMDNYDGKWTGRKYAKKD